MPECDFFFSGPHFTVYRQNALCQPTFTCSKLTIETLELGVKYIQS